MRKLKAFPLGWCASGNHSFCRGAVNNPGQESEIKVFECNCKCHHGKKVAPIETIMHAPRKGARNAEQLEEFVSKFLAFGKVEVDLPENDDEIQPLRSRMNTAGRKAKIKVRTKIQDGKIIGWVPTVRSKPRKRKKVK